MHFVCFPSLHVLYILDQGKGTDDHLLPLGYWFLFVFLYWPWRNWPLFLLSFSLFSLSLFFLSPIDTVTFSSAFVNEPWLSKISRIFDCNVVQHACVFCIFMSHSTLMMDLSYVFKDAVDGLFWGTSKYFERRIFALSCPNVTSHSQLTMANLCASCVTLESIKMLRHLGELKGLYSFNHSTFL